MTLNIIRIWMCNLCIFRCVVGIQNADIPLQSTYVTKYVDKCPEEGYFFKKDYQNGSPIVCYLCFCRDNSTAVCWPRNNRRCDAESYQHNWGKKRVSRNRRSPLNFGSLFMADAAREALNSNGKRQCKPHEASYSEGCPPADWCVGCTVCDCGNNGKWDCHLLSFCTDDNKKKDKNKKEEQTERPFDPFTIPKSRRANRKVAKQAVLKLAEKMAQDRQKKKIGKNNARRYFFRNGTLVNKTMFDLRKRKKSATIIDKGSDVVEKWNDVNMKIRKIPDNIQKQMMLDNQNKNAKKVSESANFVVRKMPNQKTKQNMQKWHAEAVSVLAKREPLRQKKRQIILPSGVKLPKEILAKLPNGVLPPSKDDLPGEHFPKTSHVKRVLTDQVAATKSPRKELPENESKLSEAIELPADKSKKVLVKRSAQEHEKSHKNVKPKINKNVKAATMGSKIINKKYTGLKEKTKQKSMQKTNTKNKDKRNAKINKNPISKLHNKTNSKDFKNNKINYKNAKQIIKKQTSKKRRLKNNYSKNITNSQTNKVIKRKTASKSSPKKTKQSNKKPKFTVKHKNNTSKRNTKDNDKNMKVKKPLSKLSRPSNSKNKTLTKETLRNKRSNKETWTKSVKEGNIVKKIAPKQESKKDNTKKHSPKALTPQIDRKKLNEQMKKITEDIQANMHRKIIDAVGRMVGHDLTQKSKKVKRSVILDEEKSRYNVSIDFVRERIAGLPQKKTVAPNFHNNGTSIIFGSQIQENLIKKGSEKQKQRFSQPSVFEVPKQKINRSEPLKNEELDYDIYVPTAYHNKVQFSTTIKNEPSKNETWTELSTAQYASKNVISAAPTPRHKRDTNENLSINKKKENEISLNGLQDNSKVLVKRSGREHEKSHKNLKPKINKNDKVATMGSKIINKKFIGLKEKSKQKSKKNTDTKNKDKRNAEINKNLKSKLYNKTNSKVYKNNNINYKNKRANITKQITKNHNSKRRSLKNNYSKNNTNSQKNKIIKRKIASKSSPKKNKQSNKKPKFIVKHKNNTSKRNIKDNDKNIKVKKPLGKLGKSSNSKNKTKTKKTSRNKRSNKETWTKSVKEGTVLKKNAPKQESKKDNIKKRSPKALTPQIDRKQLNEKIKKITGDVQANMHRKMLDAVGRMVGHDLSQKSKKVKRSVILNKGTSNIFESPIRKKIIKIDNEKQRFSQKGVFEVPEHRINRSVPLNNEELDYDVYVSTAYQNKVRFSTTIKNELSKNETWTESSTSLYSSTNVISTAPTPRRKRDKNENLSTNKRKENEMSLNGLQDITTRNKVGAQDSTFKYYEYATNNENETKSTDKNYFNKIVEMFSKNAAAKRSVDKQIQSSPGFDVLQITPSLSNNKTISAHDRNNNNSKIILPSENEKISENENFKVNAAETNIHKSTNVLDDRVVIIEDHNASSIEHLDKFVTPMHTLDVKSDLKSNLANMTVIGVLKNENILTEKPVNGTHATELNKIIEVNYGTMVDKTVVIINDQKSSTSRIPIDNPHLSISKENYRELENLTDVNTGQMPLLILTTEKTKTDEKQRNLAKISKPLSETNTTLNVTVSSTLTNTTKKSLPKLVSKHDSEHNEENIIVIREHEYQPQKNTNELNYDHSTNVLELNTENYKKSQYRIENNITKQEILSSENEVKDIETTNTTPKKTTTRIRNNFISTRKMDTNDYLTYEFDTKSSNLTQSFKMFKKLKKNEKSRSQQKSKNITGGSKFKQQINNRFKQKDSQIKVQENFLIKNNDTFLTLDPELKIYTTLNSTNSNLSQINEKSTFIEKLQNFTTLIFNNIYTSTMSLPTEKTDTNYIDPKKKLKSNDIKKLNLKKIKKHKLKKILTTLYNRKNKDERQLVENNFDIKKNVNKVNDTKNFFKKLMSGFKFNKHSRRPSNNKKFRILKYLQKFFKQIFTNDGTAMKNKTITAKTNRKHIIETLCKTFGPCNINIKNKAKLQSQLDHLNSETYKMLRSVKIIKGLLRLIDITRNDKNRTSKTLFKSDVQKLHEILRDKYSNEEHLGNLTDTQKIQIQYIKNNTQNFIQAAAKFTMVLNEIINIITEPDSKNIKNKVEISGENDTKKLLKTRSMNKTVAPMKSHESLLQLKELISKYNLVQNTFMRKIYKILTDLGGKHSAQSKIEKPSTTPSINKNVQNKTEEIQVYTKNIIENLRKLKNLAQHLNGNVRRKRELRDEESFEYLLMLMEYLLKQQKPLDPAPVDDGIDLLLEAIKSAPDIKSIQKKVLPIYNNSILMNHLPSYRVRPAKISTETNRSKESSDSDSVSDSKHSKEDNVTSSNSDEPKNNVVNNFFDDDADEDDYYTFNRRAQPSTTAEVSTTSMKELTTRVFESVTESPTYSNTSELKINAKPKSYVANSNEDLFNRFAEDEVIPPTNSIVPEFDYTSGGTAETSTNREIVTTSQIRRYNKGDDDVSASKSRLDWLDETYEEEIKAETQRLSSTTEKPLITTESYKGTTQSEKSNMSKNAKKSTHNSRFLKAVNDVTTKAVNKEIMYKKEMDLLNSLDYVNAKVDADISASRESGAIDKYGGDAFASYVS